MRRRIVHGGAEGNRAAFSFLARAGRGTIDPVRRTLLAVSLLLAACAPKKAAVDDSGDLPVDAEWFADPVPDPGPARPQEPVICGEVRVTADVASARMADVAGWVFVFARERAPTGRVIAGVKMKMARFPMPFCLTQKTVLVPGARLTGSYFLSATLSADEDPELDAGEFDGVAKAPVTTGTRGVVVTIDTFR